MKRPLFTLLLAISGVSLASPTMANCSLNYQACTKVCSVKHLTDEAAELGCNSRCVAERASCVATESAQKVGEAGKDALQKAKSFFSGMTEK